MATPPIPEAKPAKPAKKRGKLVIIIVAVLVLAAIAGIVVRLTRHSGAAQAATPAADPSTEVKSVMHLEGFVVNLGGEGENGYLRIGIDLGLGIETKEGKEEKGPPTTPRLRDAILSVLSTRTVSELLTTEGKEKLKGDILKAINDKVPEVDCKEIYFTEFLVQH